jgi:peptidoglycan/LPS O-acetylase OafA/YrhL
MSLPSKLHLFLAGALFGLLPRIGWNGRYRPILLAALQVAAAGLLVAIVWRFHMVQAELYRHVEVGLLIAAAIYVLSFNSSWSTAIFANAPMRAIGRGSFSIYLMHQLVLDYGARLLGLQRQFALLWLALSAVAVALPMIVSRYVEMPLQKSARHALEHMRDRASARLTARSSRLQSVEDAAGDASSSRTETAGQLVG